MPASLLRIFPRHYLRGVVILVATCAAVQLIAWVAEGLVDKPAVWMRQGWRGIGVWTVYRVGARLLKNGGMVWYWQAVYGLGTGYLLVLAAIEYVSGPVPFGIRASVAPLVDLLISPMIFVALGLLPYRYDAPVSAES